MGPPGGGKGTISKKIVADFQLYHVSTGDLLRFEINSKTPLGNSAQSIMQQGGLVPDKIVVDILLNAIKGKDKILLDGFPRTLSQAKLISTVINIDVVIALDIPDQVIIDRISNRLVHSPSGRTYSYDYNPPVVKGFDDVTGEPLTQRDDDKPETVQRRLSNYAAMTSPLLEYYEGKGNLRRFAGTESDKIYPHVKTLLNQLTNR